MTTLAKKAPQRTLLALALTLVLGFGGCGDSNSAEPLIPFVSFIESISVLDQRYPQLRTDNGAVEIPGGVRGLIIVRQNATTYLAFERNCPYRPYDSGCSTVSVDASRLFLVDDCCGSQFTLQGQARGGPAPRPLRQYATSISGNLLTITN
ncbi:hypothetical protein GCM10011375_07700 [Hymenobacter qilianensis]|uniref:Uncharacterized protein n=1 Tax=Hymenobacter qilianensis TaxID=1385715 RepID=A0ACB5PN42_9BACT|nr:hypothetical protein [Hymenobacter qilianensis]GGF54801.1 hypothetical protein GCM10011375_07700 [Hymenobacter qilianensis]